MEDIRELVGTEVQDEDVLEIDDGIHPTCFYLDTRLDFILKRIDFDIRQMHK